MVMAALSFLFCFRGFFLWFFGVKNIAQEPFKDGDKELAIEIIKSNLDMRI